MSNKYKSEISAAVHETAQDFHEAGVISKTTMREYDALCLTPIANVTPEWIKALRKRESVSQAIFAIHLNVSKNLISDWERGVKKPSGPALRLLTIVDNRGLGALV